MNIYEIELAVRVALAVDYGLTSFFSKTVDEGLDVQGADLSSYAISLLFSDIQSNPFNAYTLFSAYHVEELLWLRSNARDLTLINTKLDRIDQRLIDLNSRLDLFNTLIDELDSLIQRFHDLYNSFIDIQDRLNSTILNLQENLEDIENHIQYGLTSLNQLKSKIDQHFNARWEGFDDLCLNVLNNWWDNLKRNEFPTFINEYWIRFNNEINNWWIGFQENTLPYLANRYWNEFNSSIQNWWQNAKNDIIGEDQLVTLTSLYNQSNTLINRVDLAIESVDLIFPELARLLVSSDTLQTAVFAIATELTATAATVVAIETSVLKVNAKAGQIQSIFTPFTPSFFDYLDNHFNQPLPNIEVALNQYREKYKNDLIQLIGEGVLSVTHINNNSTSYDQFFNNLQIISKTISDEVTSKIVGESYYKWNSVNSFYPTIVFIMKEISDNNSNRRAQIKLKYFKQSSDITEEDIQLLKFKINLISQCIYYYGLLRVNFVSKDKQCKTTLFVNTKEDAISILSKLFDIVDLQWDPNDFTYTEGRKRTGITVRNTPLNDIPPGTDDYNTSFPLQLYKAVLLINGLERPIVLFQRS